jgi:hypothetical protein
LGLIRRHDVRGWVETPWSDFAVSGQQDPEQVAICAPALRPSPPRAPANDTRHETMVRPRQPRVVVVIAPYLRTRAIFHLKIYHRPTGRCG